MNNDISIDVLKELLPYFEKYRLAKEHFERVQYNLAKYRQLLKKFERITYTYDYLFMQPYKNVSDFSKDHLKLGIKLKNVPIEFVNDTHKVKLSEITETIHNLKKEIKIANSNLDKSYNAYLKEEQKYKGDRFTLIYRVEAFYNKQQKIKAKEAEIKELEENLNTLKKALKELTNEK